MKQILLLILLLGILAGCGNEKKDLEYWRDKFEAEGGCGAYSSPECTDEEVREYVKRLGWPNTIEE